MNAFGWAVRAVAWIALLTGAGDVIVGLSGQQMIGAALEEGYADPLLNAPVPPTPQRELFRMPPADPGSLNRLGDSRNG